MAQLLINWGAYIDSGFQRIKISNGYTDAQVSFEIPSGSLTVAADGSDWQPYTVNSNCSVDACRLFKPTGGGLVETAFPMGVFGSLTLLQTMYGASVCTTAVNEACRLWGTTGVGGPGVNPMVTPGLGSTANPYQGMFIPVDPSVCKAINTIVGIANPSGAPPVGSGLLTLGSPSNWDQYNYPLVTSFSGANFLGKKDFCYQENNGSVAGIIYPYLYVHISF